MPTHRRPPVIPEIAKAYENDPNTKMALAAAAAGASGAPVAQGGYGYADGAARVLQGMGGKYMENKQADAYGADQDQLLALRKARGVDGLSGLAPAPAPPMPGSPAAPGAGAVPNVGAVATALGAPPPAPSAPPGIPTDPIPPDAPTPSPLQGAGPGGRRPFGPSAVGGNVPAFLAPPSAEQVPDAPAPVAKPVAPEAVSPTKSRLLNAAYRVMADANPYESSSGQDMYGEGLKDQTHLDEAAAERKQHLIDAEYDTDRGIYAQAAGQDRGAAINRRESTIDHNRKLIDDYNARQFQYGVHKEDQSFEAHQKALDRANAMAVARTRAETSVGGSTALNDEERAALSKAVGEGRIDLKGITKFQAKVVAQSLVDNPGLNAVQLHARAQLAANSVAQRQAMTTEVLPEVLNNVRIAVKKMNFSDVQFAGKLQAFTKGQLNDPAFTDYMTQRNDAMLTVAQVMRGAGATDMSTKMESEAARPTMSPRAWDGWYRAQLTALLPRVQIAERRGLVDPGTTEAIRSAYGDVGGTVAPGGKTGNPLVDKYLGSH